MISVAPDIRADLAHRSIFRLRANFDGRMQDIRSEARLYCYVGGDWLVKYRISANPGFEISGLVEELIRIGPWPGRGPGSVALRRAFLPGTAFVAVAFYPDRRLPWTNAKSRSGTRPRSSMPAATAAAGVPRSWS
jgi:hypothetical protein